VTTVGCLPGVSPKFLDTTNIRFGLAGATLIRFVCIIKLHNKFEVHGFNKLAVGKTLKGVTKFGLGRLV
jgi:hypothetical protein